MRPKALRQEDPGECQALRPRPYGKPSKDLVQRRLLQHSYYHCHPKSEPRKPRHHLQCQTQLEASRCLQLGTQAILRCSVQSSRPRQPPFHSAPPRRSGTVPITRAASIKSDLGSGTLRLLGSTASPADGLPRTHEWLCTTACKSPAGPALQTISGAWSAASRAT